MLVIAIVASLLVAIQLLFRSETNQYATGLLALFMFLQALMNTMFLLVQSKVILDYWYLYRVFAPLGFLVPSLVYLYLKALLKDHSTPELKDVIHAIPMVGMFINYIPYFRLPAIEKKQVLEAVVNDYTVYIQGQEGFLPETWITIIRLLLPLIYIPLYYRVLHSTKSQFDFQIKFDREIYNWAVLFTNAVVIYFGGIMLFLAVYLVPDSIASTQVFNSFLGVAFFLTFVFWAGSFLFFSLYQILHPAIGIGYLVLSGSRSTYSRYDSSTSVKGESTKSIKSGVTQSSDPEIIEDEIHQIRRLFDEQQVWKSPTIIVSDIAREARLSVRKTSYIINRYFGGNVNVVINRYRIEHAKSMILTDYLDDYTMEGLYKECGFKNKVTFYNAFKREVGMTPSEFRAQKEAIR